jgi:hypothetical protein
VQAQVSARKFWLVMKSANIVLIPRRRLVSNENRENVNRPVLPCLNSNTLGLLKHRHKNVFSVAKSRRTVLLKKETTLRKNAYLTARQLADFRLQWYTWPFRFNICNFQVSLRAKRSNPRLAIQRLLRRQKRSSQ